MEIKKLTSDKKCTECSEILSKKSFRRGQGNICKPCMTNKVKERNNEIRDIYKIAANGCWWLERYFNSSDIERRRAVKRR